MAGKQDRIPGRDEPDPENIRFRSFQGGTDSLADTGKVKEVTYGDVHGANPEAKLVINGGASSGLSGTPQADLGNVTPQYESRDNRK